MSVQDRVALCIFVTCIYAADGHVSYAASGARKMDHVVVKTRAFPYIAAIFDGGEFLCTAALINKQLVVTAASPLLKFQGRTETLIVRIGSRSKTSGGVTTSVEQLYIHPSHKPGLPEFDVALLALKRSVITSSLHDAIATGTKKCSPKQFYSPMWYKDGSKQGNSDALHVSWYAVADRRWCRRVMTQLNITLSSNIACLLPHNGHDCLRDTGSPLVDAAPQPTQLWAIVSPWIRADCGTFPSPVLATRLTSRQVREWLQTHLAQAPSTVTTRMHLIG